MRRKVKSREPYDAFNVFVTLECGHTGVIRVGTRFAKAKTVTCTACIKAAKRRSDG